MARRKQSNQPKNKAAADLTEIGASGLNVHGGRIDEEPLLQLSGDGWRRTLRDMMNDSVVTAVLFGIEMLARQVDWDIKPFSEDPKDQEDAEFIRGALFDDMAYTWQDTLSEILTFLPWGWSFFEICYKRRSGESSDKTHQSNFTDGKIGWRKFAIRAQESFLEWELDDYNEVTALKQMPAPDYLERRVPSEKALHFRTSSQKSNPEGRSILRGAYRDWYFKVHIQNIEGIGIERDLAGLPVIKAPAELFSDTATSDQKAVLESLRQMVKQIRRDESEGIVMPLVFDEQRNPLYEFSLLSTGGRRQVDISAVINRCDHRMLLSVLADFMMLGSSSVGSYALSTDKTEMFAAALSSWLDAICQTINRQAIPKLLKLNGRPTDRLPKLIHGEVERVSLSELGEFLSKVNGIGIEFDREEIAYIKSQAGIPKTPESVKKEIEKEEADKSKEPEPNPEKEDTEKE